MLLQRYSLLPFLFLCVTVCVFVCLLPLYYSVTYLFSHSYSACAIDDDVQ